MRIIAEIDHPHYKITVFQMNGKLSVKLEKDLMEQTYKFRDGSGIERVEEVELFLNEGFMENVDHSFTIMNKARLDSLLKMNDEEDNFEVII